MKVYAIAAKTHECYGHGSYGEELRICKEGTDQGGQGGSFPPVFETRESAERYRKGIKYLILRS